MTKSRKARIYFWLLVGGVPLVLGAVVLAFFLMRSGPVDTGPTLFIIQRSKNANEVHYEVQANADGSLKEEPVIAYWVLKADGGGREDLGWFEKKMAYGFDVEDADSKGEREMKLTAWEDRTLTLKKDENGKWRALTKIDGKEAYLTRLFIKTDESGITPSVLSIDLYGEEVDGGDPVEEHVDKK
jgi:hypothetical protein